MKRSLAKKILKPVEKFLHLEASSGIILAISATLAMVLANSSWAGAYFHLLEIKILGLTVQHWINDGLMVIFFFVIGMELKKEVLTGELRTLKSASLPIAAALGGMLVPAAIYYFFNNDGSAVSGWGIPMATDIAFALGILSLFGRRVPLAVKVFLLALAIVDDLGAILVIAFFYTQEIRFEGLAVAAAAIALIGLIQKAGVKPYWIYVTVGICVWAGVLYSGVHATIAGVIIGFLTPLQFKISKDYQATYSPLDNLIHWLHPWVSFAIMPVFALANAGINLQGLNLAEIVSHPVHRGVALGLLAGKAFGIFIFSRIFVALGWGRLPSGVNWWHILGVGFLGGVGFTMALFISNLALTADLAIYSKTGIILGSAFSGVAGSVMLAWALRKRTSLPEQI